MKLFKMFKRGQKGFTLVELMVVMAIMAVLATIVIPPVTGTKQVSSDTQVKQDAAALQTAVGKYNSESNGAEMVTTNATQLFGASENTSSKWPEVTLFSAYSGELIAETILLDKNGTTDRTNYAEDAISPIEGPAANLRAGYRAINWTTLISSGALAETPSSESLLNNGKHNYLWLLRVTTIAGAANTAGTATFTTGRSVEVYSLTTVTSDGVLTYQRIY